MTEYMFRGKPITGFHAHAILASIRMVEKDAPNPTPEDIKALEEIVAAFDVEFVESLRQAHEDEDEWLGDE